MRVWAAFKEGSEISAVKYSRPASRVGWQGKVTADKVTWSHNVETHL